MTTCKLTPEDIKGVFALIPACAKANAASAKETDTVDTEALASLIDKVINEGVHGILMTGSLGETHTLLWEEHQKLITTTVETVRKRVPVFIGTTSLNTRETIRKTKFAEDVGADGVMNGTPMYLPTSVPNALQYYRDIAEACPKMAIMVYHNPFAFRFTIPPPVWGELAKIPNVIATKQGSLDIINLLASIKMTQGKIAVLVLDLLMYPMMWMGASGGWSSDVCMGPSLSLKYYNACASGDWKLAGQIGADRIRAFVTSLGMTIDEFQEHQVNWTKISIDESGYGKVGPGRPPFVHTPKKVEESAKAYAKAWLELSAKYK